MVGVHGARVGVLGSEGGGRRLGEFGAGRDARVEEVQDVGAGGVVGEDLAGGAVPHRAGAVAQFVLAVGAFVGVQGDVAAVGGAPGALDRALHPEAVHGEQGAARVGVHVRVEQQRPARRPGAPALRGQDHVPGEHARAARQHDELAGRGRRSLAGGVAARPQAGGDLLGGLLGHRRGGVHGELGEEAPARADDLALGTVLTEVDEVMGAEDRQAAVALGEPDRLVLAVHDGADRLEVGGVEVVAGVGQVRLGGGDGVGRPRGLGQAAHLGGRLGARPVLDLGRWVFGRSHSWYGERQA